MSSYEEVTAILAQCRISHFRQAFLDNECDDSFLDIVEDGDLRELGLPLGIGLTEENTVSELNGDVASKEWRVGGVKSSSLCCEANAMSLNRNNLLLATPRSAA